MAQSKKKDLGKGIRALLSTIDDELKVNETTINGANASKQTAIGIGRIPLDKIKTNPKQPRYDFDESALNELAESIKLHDIIQPITVIKLKDGYYQLISGERRWRASKMAGLETIPAYLREANDQEILEMALLENLQRENLNAIEIALSYKRLMDECELTQELVAERMKKERSTVANYLRLLKLPPDIQKAVRDGELTMGHARAIIGLDKVDEQLYVFRECQGKGMSVRQVEALVKSMQQETKMSTPKTKETNKLPAAYKRIEDDMASHFSAKVVLSRKKNGKGNIAIDFYSDEELERIMEIMGL
ncbi:MAG TPA: ParB/RepB/Spo0J family partition protein [Edaphocola sp.]|nr:ParB/RepB/Spo0J family partition protein [Edaphocola sp.]